jgi:serine phosphatase RsbU (regulator of sigma subunit)
MSGVLKVRTGLCLRLVALVAALLMPALTHAKKDNNSTKPDSSNRVAFIGTLPKSEYQDTLRYFGLFRNYLWNAELHYKNDSVVRIQSFRVDTLEPDYTRDCNKVRLYTRFRLDSMVWPVIAALRYEVQGSLLIKQNGISILETGVFANAKRHQSSRLKLDEFHTIMLADSIQDFDIVCLPDQDKFSLDIELGQKAWAEDNIEKDEKEANSDFAIGFFYFAFGVVFLSLFLFHHQARENLYFALFCLCGAGGFVLGYLENRTLTILGVGCGILLFEWLSIFFAKIIKNVEKTKIPVILLTIAIIIVASPLTKGISVQDDTFSFSDDGDFDVRIISMLLLFLFIGLTVLYSIISILYYLIQGFWQKRWDAKAIVYICSLATILAVIVPMVMGMNNGAKGIKEDEDLIQMISSIGFCLYPVSAAIVLGRRNRVNQVQLVQQIESIRLLSEQNLEREREKQELLEKQNSELERMVIERTREVTFQKEEIEIKNKSITDNLNYARRIQSALLPDLHLIRKHLPDLSLVYFPKDIVSGDFYFFAHKNHHLVIAAGDCTGHGVSGAFMSMIGSSLLQQIVNERGVLDPSHILEQLNIAVIDTFRQTQSETNDGMDIALCVIDQKTNELHFAGANRPLWLIRGELLQTYPPDKAPIGGLQMARDRSFHKTSINLLPGDTIYIFTDGYADQFGGDRGKKMMSAKFREFLITINNQTMEKQEDLLRKHFLDWKKDHEQVDDVLVIGFKV